MTTLFERMFVTVFGQAGREFIEGLNRSSSRLSDFVYVKLFGLPFIVLGARQTGKTTLIEWMRHNMHELADFDPSPTAPGGDGVPTFSARIGGESMRLKPTRDVGGEYDMWETDWVDLFREAQPRGIIFLVDHTDVLAHKDALNFVMNLIDEEVEAKRNLKAFLILVNKSDLWGGKLPMDDLLHGYGNEIKRLKNQAGRIGFTTWIVGGSVQDGVTMTGEPLHTALRNFFNAIRPRPR
ncbi:MAG: ADP-ribosylation factor-like protein [bacterium]|nr:ADP-ribosylation factor-like protein [bacterium]